ncbi:hypothetical protein BKA69DRAFT_1071954 [Paraphysoderma sedebokerense]|nr:hypothetical protein BKA69DRAFT_1071954 [Paraphysoderma sedebokerense]
MFSRNIFLLFISIAISSSLQSPTPESTEKQPKPHPHPETNNPISLPQLLAISPTPQIACNASAQFADECRTAADALPYINSGLDKYGLSSTGERVAVLSLLSFESGGFKFNRNHFPAPGRPGQGTRSMLMFPFIQEYVASIPDLKPQYDKITSASTNTSSPEYQSAVLSLVLSDEYSFASAMWFLSSKCSTDVRNLLKQEKEEGVVSYLKDCIGTEATEERLDGWRKSLQAYHGITDKKDSGPNSSGPVISGSVGSGNFGWFSIGYLLMISFYLFI